MKNNIINNKFTLIREESIKLFSFFLKLITNLLFISRGGIC